MLTHIQGIRIEVATSLFVDLIPPPACTTPFPMDDIEIYHMAVLWCAESCDRIRMRSAATSVSVHQVRLVYLLFSHAACLFMTPVFIRCAH